MADIIASPAIRENYQAVIERIEQASRRAGRSPHEVRLVVVTKTHSAETIRAVSAAGARWVGESYVDEAVEKINVLNDSLSLEWHMIGHIQSRKARQVCESFQLVHALDSLKLAEHLSRFAADRRQPLPVLLECNVSGETSKYGWPAWQEEQWEGLLPVISRILDLPNLKVDGLMTIAPYSELAESARPYFQRLRRLRDYLAGQFPESHLNELSMGMSGDFEIAIEEGATWVRVGQAILGSRP